MGKRHRQKGRKEEGRKEGIIDHSEIMGDGKDGKDGKEGNARGNRKNSTVLVTVGTTRFDALTRAADSLSLVRLLESYGYNRFVIQIGSSETFFPSELLGGGESLGEGAITRTPLGGFQVTCFRYAPTLKDIMDESGLVISHAGAGSIFEGLRAGKRLIAVPNRDLMDNHQADLCAHLKSSGYIEVADVNGLEEAVVRMEQRQFGEGAEDLKPYEGDSGIRGIGEAILGDFFQQL